MQLFDAAGQRKYLTPAQRQEFLRAAAQAPREVFTFCGTLAHGGCRISEALALTGTRVDIEAGVIVFESLKQRRKGMYRAVPVPSAFLETIEAAHDLVSLGGARLWKLSTFQLKKSSIPDGSGEAASASRIGRRVQIGTCNRLSLEVVVGHCAMPRQAYAALGGEHVPTKWYHWLAVGSGHMDRRNVFRS